MKIKSQRDCVCGVLFIAVGLAFALGATGYRLGNSAQPGPGYFPLLLGGILALLGVAVLFKALTIESDGGDPIGAIAWRPLTAVLAAVVVFGLLLPRLGVVLTVPVLVVVASLASAEFRWKGAAAAAVLLSLGGYLVAVRWLGLQLPVWPVGLVA